MKSTRSGCRWQWALLTLVALSGCSTDKILDRAEEATVDPPPLTARSKPSGRILFVRDEQIYSIEVNSRQETRLARLQLPPGGLSYPFDGNLDISSDIRRIVFASSGDKRAGASAREVTPDIFIADLDGSNRQRLTQTPGVVSLKPKFSPDDSIIVFQAGLLESWNPSALYLLKLDNENALPPTALPITPLDGRDAAFSNDGKRIVFSSSQYDPAEENSKISTINVDGTGLMQLTRNTAFDTQPALSPDGKKIAFVSSRDGNNEIYVMDVNGAGQTRLTRNKAVDAMPTWSPDGQHIVWLSKQADEDESRIYVMNADGTQQIRLSDGFTTNLCLQWR